MRVRAKPANGNNLCTKCERRIRRRCRGGEVERWKPGSKSGAATSRIREVTDACGRAFLGTSAHVEEEDSMSLSFIRSRSEKRGTMMKRHSEPPHPDHRGGVATKRHPRGARGRRAQAGARVRARL